MQKNLALAFLIALLALPLGAQIPGSATLVGRGCAPTAVTPELQVTAPRVGMPVTLSVLHSFNPSPIAVFASPGVPLNPPLRVGVMGLATCEVYVDLMNAFELAMLSGVAIPPAMSVLQVPADPALAGEDLTLQAVVLVPNFPPNLQPIVTNGVYLVIGS